MLLHPSSGNEYAVVRWTAPVANTYYVSAYWQDEDPHGGNGATGDIVLNGTSLFSGSWANGGTAVTSGTLTLNLTAGARIDFLVGSSGDWAFDSTRFNATIIPIPEPSVSLFIPLGLVALAASRRCWRRPRR
jgi:hypothetical protein